MTSISARFGPLCTSLREFRTRCRSHSGPGRAERAKRDWKPAGGLCGDLKGQSPPAGSLVPSIVTIAVGAGLAIAFAMSLAPVAGAAAVTQQAPAPSPTTAGQASQMPGGATSMQETHGDWTVMCAQKEGTKACAMSQQLLDRDSRQRVLALELDKATSDSASGNLLLPFGLAVDRQVSLQLNGSALGEPLHFWTCVPNGCLVSLTFDAKTVADLKRGTTLTVQGIAAEGGKPVSFTLSLKGFSSALDRTASLQK
jgi:invasion protein IalB